VEIIIMRPALPATDVMQPRAPRLHYLAKPLPFLMPNPVVKRMLEAEVVLPHLVQVIGTAQILVVETSIMLHEWSAIDAIPLQMLVVWVLLTCNKLQLPGDWLERRQCLHNQMLALVIGCAQDAVTTITPAVPIATAARWPNLLCPCLECSSWVLVG